MKNDIRLDYKLILEIVESDSKVLDLGCGDGELLKLLKDKKNVRGVGIENDEEMIYACVSKDVTVEHSDIDEGLPDFPYAFFDYCILNFTLQQTKRSKKVINEALRVGRKVIIAFPNFAFYSVRLSIGLLGRTPETKALPYRWYDTPNLRYFSIKDFRSFCYLENITIEKAIGFTGNKKIGLFPNLFAEQAIFVLKKQK